MQKKLFTQIRNEWRGNLWLALELLVVSVVMWYIIDLLYCRLATYLEPRGFNTEHCYLIRMGRLTDKSPDYRPDSKTADDIRTLVDRLSHRPEVEAVSLSQNSYPYNGSNGSDPVEYDTLRTNSYVVRRLVTPDFVRVFRYRGMQGETPDQLAEMLRRSRYGVRLTSLAGKDGFHLFGDTTMNFRLGASLQPVRYDDFEQARFCRTFLFNLEELDRMYGGWINIDNELCVRVRPDQDRDFIERLKADSEAQYRIGNVYISDVRSFADIRRNYQQREMNQLRNCCIGMGFLLLNIFLGPAQGERGDEPRRVRPPAQRGAASAAHRHHARAAYRPQPGQGRDECLAQRHDAGVGPPVVVRGHRLRPHRPDDCHRHLVSGPSGDPSSRGSRCWARPCPSA